MGQIGGFCIEQARDCVTNALGPNAGQRTGDVRQLDFEQDAATHLAVPTHAALQQCLVSKVCIPALNHRRRGFLQHNCCSASRPT